MHIFAKIRKAKERRWWWIYLQIRRRQVNSHGGTLSDEDPSVKSPLSTNCWTAIPVTRISPVSWSWFWAWHRLAFLGYSWDNVWTDVFFSLTPQSWRSFSSRPFFLMMCTGPVQVFPRVFKTLGVCLTHLSWKTSPSLSKERDLEPSRSGQYAYTLQSGRHFVFPPFWTWTHLRAEKFWKHMLFPLPKKKGPIFHLDKQKKEDGTYTVDVKMKS